MREIGKYLITVIMVLVLLKPGLAYFQNIEVDDLRQHTFILLHPDEDPGIMYSLPWWVVHNPDGRDMFVTMQIIPIPSGDCYGDRVHCNTSDYNTAVRIDYDGSSVYADTTSCWDWWVVDAGATGLQQREENKTLCPLVSIPYNPDVKRYNVSFNFSTPINESLGLNVRVFTYSTAYSDKTYKYSTTADDSFANVASLVMYNRNIWRLIYYSFVITLVVVGAIIVVGGIPIAIKWIMSKMRG